MTLMPVWQFLVRSSTPGRRQERKRIGYARRLVVFPFCGIVAIFVSGFGRVCLAVAVLVRERYF